MCGVMLAAGGFTLTASVYLFNLKKFKPIVRPTVLTAFLGYQLVVVGLLFDLGRSYRIWHPLVMWNPRSVMFEVAWCVTLYSIVLSLEFGACSLSVSIYSNLLRIQKMLLIPLVIAGRPPFHVAPVFARQSLSDRAQQALSFLVFAHSADPLFPLRDLRWFGYDHF